MIEKRFAALAMAVVALPALADDVEVFVGQPIIAGEEYLIAGWNFNDVTVPPESQLEASHGIGLLSTNWETDNIANFSGTTANLFNGDVAGRDFGLQSGADQMNEGRHLEFALSLKNFESLILTYATQRSSTGFTEQAWSWSLDGENFADVATVLPPSSHAVQTVDFSSVTELDGEATLYVRMVIRGLPDNPRSNGNNRLDNVQFRARARVGTAGPGTATVENRTVGSPLKGSRVFVPDSVQSVALHLAGSGAEPIETVTIALPENWSGLLSDNVEVSGPGLGSATVSVEGGTVVLANAAIAESAGVTVILHQIETPAEAEIGDFGRTRFGVRTAIADGELAEIGKSPEGLLIVPVSSIRPVDAHGVAVALHREVAVAGVATVDSGIFSVTRFVTYLQDATAGVAIDYSPITDIWTGAVLGHRYVAVGTVTQVRGATQISLSENDGFMALGPDAMPEPKLRTVSQLLAEAEVLEGSLVRVARISKAEASEAWPEPGLNGTLTVTDDGGVHVVDVFLNRFTDASVYSEPDYEVDLVGIFSQHADASAPFLSGYQVLPRGYHDFLPASEIESGWEDWRQVVFDADQLGNSAISGMDRDPDGDGLANLLEYALGGDPLANSRHLLPNVALSGGFLEIRFRRMKAAADLVYQVHASDDFVEWDSIWSSEDFPYSGEEPVVEEVVADVVPVEGNSRRFLKLVVLPGG